MARTLIVSDRHNSFFSANNIRVGNQIPTEGNYVKGDIIVNIGDNTASEAMWICVESGNPGIWEVVGAGAGGNGGSNFVSINDSVFVNEPVNEVSLSGLGVGVSSKDKLIVHHNSVHLMEGVDYEISEDGTKILKLTEGNWNDDSEENALFAFELFKGVESIDGDKIVVDSKLTSITNHVIIENACSEVEIGIEGFNAGNDMMLVFKNGVNMVEGVDYEVQGGKIVSTGEVWNENGIEDYGMTFVVFKEVVEYNGDAEVKAENIADGSIGMDKLADDVKGAIEDASNIDLSGYVEQEEYNGKIAELEGKVNEAFTSANNGKQLIANAIGEPVSAEDTFSAMSNDINSLLSSFKTNMMNNGVAVESGDKFKQLIDKIATLADNEGKGGIQFAMGEQAVEGLNIYDLDFTPNYIFVEVTGSQTVYAWQGNYLVSNLNTASFTYTRSGEVLRNTQISITDISNTSFNIYIHDKERVDFGKWYAIGVGEEDTTLRDSLASILTEEGVSVTEEDDMASLITKVDEEFIEKNNEIASKVNPAGTAVAGDVLSGKTFINSTGQTITGTMVNRGGAQTVTPGTSNKTLNAGYYSGNITVAGDADLVAANIVSGKNIFGVAGTAIKAPNVTAGSSYYLLRGVYVSGQHSVDYYGGYIKNGKIYSNQNYIWFRMYFPFSGTISIDYIYYFTDWYNQIKVYNKAGTLVNQTANEKVGNANTRLTHNLQVEAGGRIDICGYGLDYGTNGADTSTPDSNYLQDLNVKFSLS